MLDRTSFLRFLGLEHSARVPDAKTIWVWRDRCNTHDLIGTISAAVSGQLDRAGVIARGGQIIDASIVSAPIQRNTREENAAIKRDEVPQDWSAAKRVQKDVDARWTKTHGKAFCGARQHGPWPFIRRHDVTPAQVHDSQRFETLLDLSNTRRTVRADSAYADRERKARLREQGYVADIPHKGRAGKQLSAAQQRRNHRMAKDRAFGEHPFAQLAQQGGSACARSGWRERRW